MCVVGWLTIRCGKDRFCYFAIVFARFVKNTAAVTHGAFVTRVRTRRLWLLDSGKYTSRTECELARRLRSLLSVSFVDSASPSRLVTRIVFYVFRGMGVGQSPGLAWLSFRLFPCVHQASGLGLASGLSDAHLLVRLDRPSAWLGLIP